MTAPAGAVVRIFVDLVARVHADDVIETRLFLEALWEASR